VSGSRSLTVVVPTYRRPDLLRSCLAGLEVQSHRPDEVLLVIRSTDQASLDVARSSPLPVRIVEPAAPGVVPAMRSGLAAVRTEIAVMVDDDAVAAPDLLQRYEEAFVDPRVVAVGGFNQVYVDGERHDHTTRRVGQLSWTGRMVGMHYARSGLESVPVDHLQGCNMALRAPIDLPDLALHGDGSYYELDLSLRAGRRGVVLYDERLHVDHYLGGRADRDADAIAGALAARKETDLKQVADSCWNYSYVLSKNTTGRLQRAVRLLDGLLVGQRRTWGLARVAAEAVRQPSRQWWEILVVATRCRWSGWAAGRAARGGS